MRTTKEPDPAGTATASPLATPVLKPGRVVSVAPEARVLLVDPEEALHQTRTLLLRSLGRPVDVVANLRAVWNLPRDTPYCFAAVSLTSGLADVPSLLTAVRSLWPAARILLLGKSVTGIDDHQYDERVDPSYRPRDLIEMAQRLISARPFVKDQEVQ